VLELVLSVTEVDVRTVAALMASSRSLAEQLCSLPIRKLVVAVCQLDTALGAAQWLTAYSSSSMCSCITELEVKWDGDMDEDREDPARALPVALFALRHVKLQRLAIAWLQVPASLFGVSPQPPAWTNSLQHLELKRTGAQSVLHLSGLTQLTSLHLGGSRDEDYGMATSDDSDTLQWRSSPSQSDKVVTELPSSCPPTSLRQLHTVGLQFDSLTHLEHLTALTVWPYVGQGGGAWPELPASSALQALDLDSYDAIALAAISSTPNLTSLKLSHSAHDAVLLRQALVQLRPLAAVCGVRCG
jgi:hypothetical protein